MGEAPVPGTGQSLMLYRGKDDFSIKITGGGRSSVELMNSRKHGSEDALGKLPCQRLKQPESARVLVGGLGMGFTLAAVLATVGPGAVVTVAELIPEVVEWNRGLLGECSGHPLKDKRTRVFVGDVDDLLVPDAAFDVIALDVDNGPEGLTTRENDQIYSLSGILKAAAALNPGGILAYWSAGPDRRFRQRLEQCGLNAEEISVYAHGHKGARHTIWLARTR